MLKYRRYGRFRAPASLEARPRRDDHAEETDAHDVFELSDPGVVDCRGATDPGARDQNVGPPSVRQSEQPHPAPARAGGDRRRTTRPILPKLAGERIEPRRVTIDQADTALRKQPAETHAERAGCSADDDDLFRGSHIVSLFPVPWPPAAITQLEAGVEHQIDHLNQEIWRCASGTVPTLTLQ